MKFNSARVSKPHTSVCNIKFCLYGMYVWWSVCCGQLSRSHVSHAITKYAYFPGPFYFLHRPSMSNRETMLERCRQREWEMRLRMKEPPHCAAYTLRLAHAHSTMFYIPLGISVCRQFMSHEKCTKPTIVIVSNMMIF